MKFVNDRHLGGYVAADEQYPNGDPMTYTPKVWEFLLNKYHPQTVLDVGCGQGHSTKWFLDHLDKDKPRCWVVGIDGCAEAIQSSVVPYDILSRRYATLVKHDFAAKPFGSAELGLPYADLAWSCEFVEHVHENQMHNFLETFELANVVAMTHAFPGQQGHHHVNCQPAEYWIDKMLKIGFKHNASASAEARDIAESSHWKRSGLIFEKLYPQPVRT